MWQKLSAPPPAPSGASESKHDLSGNQNGGQSLLFSSHPCPDVPLSLPALSSKQCQLWQPELVAPCWKMTYGFNCRGSSVSLRKEPAPPGLVPVDKSCQVGEGSPAHCPLHLGGNQALPSLLGCPPALEGGVGWSRSMDAVGCV